VSKPFTLEHFRRWAGDLVLDTGEPWVVEDFFAWWLEDLFSGFKENWLIVPEGNSKTTGLGGLGLYHCQFRTSASVPIAASSREQAEIMYRQAEGFVLRSESLKGFKCQEGYRRIKYLADGSRIQVFAADDRTGDGVIPTLPLLDELHRQKDLRLYRTWRGKLPKRDGQLGAISTAGEPGGEFEETRERIRQTAQDLQRDGCFLRAVSGGVVLHEWAVPEDGDVEDMELVKAANPFSRITVPMLQEKRDSPTMTVEHWRRFVCNLPTRSGLAAINEAEWFAAESKEQIPEQEPVWVGLDVAWKWDTTAAVPLWTPDERKRLLGPASILEPPRDGTSLDPNKVEHALIQIHQRNPVHTVVMDMSRAEQLAEWIQAELGATVVDRSQSNKFAAEDYEKFMEALREGWLKHSGDRGLTRHALNAIARILPYGDARFDRPSQTRQGGDQDRRVIDGLTASAMVNSVASAKRFDGDFIYQWEAA
jgi:hypothetical protein